jgi:hypothetical protein
MLYVLKNIIIKKYVCNKYYWLVLLNFHNIASNITIITSMTGRSTIQTGSGFCQRITRYIGRKAGGLEVHIFPLICFLSTVTASSTLCVHFLLFQRHVIINVFLFCKSSKLFCYLDHLLHILAYCRKDMTKHYMRHGMAHSFSRSITSIGNHCGSGRFRCYHR